MLDALCPFIATSENVTPQLLDIVLFKIIEPQKSLEKNAYDLAKRLIIKTNELMEHCIQKVIEKKTRVNQFCQTVPILYQNSHF